MKIVRDEDLDNYKEIVVNRNSNSTICSIRFVAMYYDHETHSEHMFGVVIDPSEVFAVNERVVGKFIVESKIQRRSGTRVTTRERLKEQVGDEESEQPEDALKDNIDRSREPIRVHSTQGSYIKTYEGIVYSTYAPITRVGKIFEEICIQRRIV